MNLVSLQTFIAIVETGSLVRASAKLNVTQSTVTARIKTLEESLGQRLLNRQKSGATLTPAGTKLLRYAHIMNGLWRQAKYETSLPDNLSAVCTFGCDRELWHGAGQAFFNGLITEHPEMAITVHQGSNRDLGNWLSAGMVDIILTFDAVARGNQTVYQLPPEELVLYSDRPVTPINGDKQYIYVDHGEEYRLQHDEFYHDAGVARIKFDSSWWALQCMLERGGSAYLPRSLGQSYADRGKLYDVPAAPVFTRKKNLVINDTAVENWFWFAGLIERLSKQ